MAGGAHGLWHPDFVRSTRPTTLLQIKMAAIYPVYVIQQFSPAVSQRARMRLSIVVQTGIDVRGCPLYRMYCAEGCEAMGYHFRIFLDVTPRKLPGYQGRTLVGSVDSRQLRAFEEQLSYVDLHDGVGWAYYALRRLVAQQFRIDVWTPEALRPRLEEGYMRWRDNLE